MLLKNNFKIIQTLHENDSTLIYRAIRLRDNKNVIVKKLKQEYRNEYKIDQFINEEKILTKLNAKSIIEILDTVSKPSAYFHILEDIGGDSLYNIILKHRFSLEEALDIALLSMRGVEYLHKNHIIHADINPKNMIYNEKTRDLQIIDFGLSIKEEEILLEDKKPLNSSGNPFYIAPEQTGLTEYKIDYRSDIYSLGMSLYHIFLGKVPLKAKDQYELLHKQLVLNPTPLHEADVNIPRVLSDIIEKMISKDPFKRYQNDEAIIYDFKKCIQNLDKSNSINYFKIATLDTHEIRIGDTIFGRDKELNILKNTLKNADTAPLRVLVSGVSGTGKTSLVNDFLHDIDSINVIVGKFDKYKIYLPYVGYKQIFSNLFRIISRATMQTYIKKMHTNTPKILNIFFPELNYLFNTTTKGHDIAEFIYTKEQLSFAVIDLFKVIATQKMPLIIFFDDLQWIDQASSVLLKSSVLNANNPYVHFIATIRDEEDGHNLNLFNIKELMHKDKKYKTLDINITNFSKKDVNDMLQTLLMQDCTNLANIVYKKTDGNPFYIKIFMEFLLENRDLYFEGTQWNYSTSKISKYNSSDNITELVRTKLNKLTQNEKLCLQYLVILGNKFNLSLALEILKYHNYKHSIMTNLIKNGFINIHAGTYQFSHDTIQQDIFISIDEKTRFKIHKDIGLYLEKKYNANKFHDIIPIAYHLNRAYPSDKAPKRLFKLNIASIKEMLNNNSYALALSKMEWIDKTIPQVTFEYSLLKARVLYLNSKLEEANKQVFISIKNAKNIKEKLLCFNLLKDISATSVDSFKQAFIFGSELLTQLGLNIPSTNKGLSNAVQSLSKNISAHKLFYKPKDIINHSILKNQKVQCISDFLVQYCELAYYLADVELMKWCFFKIINLSFKYGNSTESAFAYALYGSYLVEQKEYKKARIFGDIALKLNANFADTKMLPEIHNFVANFINPYTKRVNTNIKLYKKSLLQSKMDGNIVFGTWANFLMHFSNYLSGESLETVVLDMQNESEFILNSGDKKMIAIFNILKSTINELQTQDIASLENEKAVVQMWEKDNFYPTLAWYAVIKAQQSFLNNEIENGLKFLDLYVHSDLNEIIMFPKINLHFIRALLLSQTDTELNNAQKETLKTDLDEINRLYKSSPSVFRFYKLILEAQSKKSSYSTWDIASRYDKAIDEAKKQKNNLFIAIANLSASRFWSSLEFFDMKSLYLNEAISALNQWDAYDVARKRKSLLTQKIKEKSINTSLSSSSRIKQSNFQALLKSYNAISQSTDKKTLVDTFMKIILQHATAGSGAIILKDKDNFYVTATMDYTKNTFAFINEKIRDYEYLPKSLIRAVLTEKQPISINHPSQSGQFQFDQYFKNYKPSSAVAIPIKTEGEVNGVLYLQNDELPINLDEDTIKTLELLLTQFYIVFNNIRLYENLKINDANLNKAQKLLHVGSWELDFTKQEILWSAETYRIFDIKPFSVKLDYDMFLSFLHPDDKDDFVKAKNKAIKNNSLCDVEHRIITKKGNIKYVIQKAEIFIKNGKKIMSGTIQDITQTKKDQEQISLLYQVIEQSPNSIVMTNTSGNIEYINRQFTKNTGYAKDEILGSNMNILNSHKQSASFYEDLWSAILVDKKIWRGTIIDKVKNGKLLDFHTTIFPVLNSQNRVISLVAVQDDVTEKNLHDKLFLMQSRQAQMGEMISMIAHQWRQPLGAISATAIALEMQIRLESYDLSTKEGQEEQTEYFLKQLKKIEEFVSGLSHTIDDFRNFYKPNKLPVKSTLKEIVLKSLNIMRNSLKSHNILLIEEYNSDKELELYDSEMIQVVLNIIKNSQDAFDEKNEKNASIKITTYDDEITICDNAGGIPKDIIDKIFEVYFSTKSEKNGTGIGLYMSKTIVERHHNGVLSVKNVKNGVCFSIKVKKATSSAPPHNGTKLSKPSSRTKK